MTLSRRRLAVVAAAILAVCDGVGAAFALLRGPDEVTAPTAGPTGSTPPSTAPSTVPAVIGRPVDAGGFPRACSNTGTATTSGIPEATVDWELAPTGRRPAAKGST